MYTTIMLSIEIKITNEDDGFRISLEKNNSFGEQHHLTFLLKEEYDFLNDYSKIVLFEETNWIFISYLDNIKQRLVIDEIIKYLDPDEIEILNVNYNLKENFNKRRKKVEEIAKNGTLYNNGNNILQKKLSGSNKHTEYENNCCYLNNVISYIKNYSLYISESYFEITSKCDIKEFCDQKLGIYMKREYHIIKKERETSNFNNIYLKLNLEYPDFFPLENQEKVCKYKMNAFKFKIVERKKFEDLIKNNEYYKISDFSSKIYNNNKEDSEILDSAIKSQGCGIFGRLQITNEICTYFAMMKYIFWKRIDFEEASLQFIEYLKIEYNKIKELKNNKCNNYNKNSCDLKYEEDENNKLDGKIGDKVILKKESSLFDSNFNKIMQESFISILKDKNIIRQKYEEIEMLKNLEGTCFENLISNIMFNFFYAVDKTEFENYESEMFNEFFFKYLREIVKNFCSEFIYKVFFEEIILISFEKIRQNK